MQDFVRATGREPHFERTKLLLANHPEAKDLVGNAPITSLAVFGIVALQLVVAYLLRDSAWWTIWLALYFIAQMSRVPLLHRVKLIDAWYVANVLTQGAFIAVVVYAWGWASLIYLLLSSILAIGLHPVGARWIQEHFLTHPGGQETFSYYGPLNVLAFNVGYHNEHHDLMRVPWMRLPRIRRAAPEMYDSLHYHTSWTALLF